MKSLALIIFMLLMAVNSFAQEVDLAVAELNVSERVILGQKTNIDVVLENKSDADLNGCLFKVEATDEAKVEQLVVLPKNARQRVEIKWIPQKEGKLSLKASISPPDGIKDKDESNNQAHQEVQSVAR